MHHLTSGAFEFSCGEDGNAGWSSAPAAPPAPQLSGCLWKSS